MKKKFNKQLTIFDAVGDSDQVSPTKPVGDTENQALERYLGRAKVEFTVCVKNYKPNGRKTEYFRLDYRVGKKVKSIHICGGNVHAPLAQERAKEIRLMTDRGAQLEEIIAAVEAYRGRRNMETN